MKKTLSLGVALLLVACGGAADHSGMGDAMTADSTRMGDGAAMTADSAEMGGIGGMGEMGGMKMADTSSMGGMMDPDTSGIHH